MKQGKKRTFSVLLAAALCTGTVCVPLPASGTIEARADTVVELDGVSITIPEDNYTNFLLIHAVETYGDGITWDSFYLACDVTDVIYVMDNVYRIAASRIYCLDQDGNQTSVVYDTATTMDPNGSYFSTMEFVGSDGTVLPQKSGESSGGDGTVEPVVTITMPKSITLDGGKKSASYDISVSVEDIDSYSDGAFIVTVEPVDDVPDVDGINFYMSDDTYLLAAKPDVPATVVQERTEWTVRDIADGKKAEDSTITASGLTAGDWSGILQFDISINTGTDQDGTEKDNTQDALDEDNSEGTEEETVRHMRSPKRQPEEPENTEIQEEAETENPDVDTTEEPSGEFPAESAEPAAEDQEPEENPDTDAGDGQEEPAESLDDAGTEEEEIPPEDGQ